MNETDSCDGSLVPPALKEGISRFVVGAVVAHQGKALLLRRRQNDFLGGIYELPSGVVEEGETLGEALVREVEEETGLEPIPKGNYVGFFDYFSGSGRATRQFNFLVEVAAHTLVRLTEHDTYVWADREALAELTVTDETRLAVSLALSCGRKSNLESDPAT